MWLDAIVTTIVMTFVSMLIRTRRSKDLLLQYQSFECSSCSHLILAYTVRLAIINGLFFFTFIEECCFVIEKNIDKKLVNRISYQIWYKRCLKGKFDRGVQIRCDTGTRQNKINFIFWIWKLATPQVTWNVFLTITQGNDLVFSIT